MPTPIPAPQTTWGWLVVIYLFVAGVGAGAYLTSWWTERHDFPPHLSAAGRYLAAPLVIAGTAMLFFDLGAGFSQPWRVIGLYTHPTSMMSLGTWVLSIFVVLALIDGYAPLVRWHGARLPRFRRLGTVTAVFAVFVAVYTGLLLGVVSAVPFWNNPVLPVLFAVSAVSTGMAATLAGTVIVSHRGEGAAKFGRLHVGFIGAEAVVLALFLFFAATSPQEAARSSFDALIGGGFAVPFWLGLVVVGLALPFVYDVFAHRDAFTTVLHSPAPILIESAFVLVGGFVLRYLVVCAGSIDHVFVSVS